MLDWCVLAGFTWTFGWLSYRLMRDRDYRKDEIQDGR